MKEQNQKNETELFLVNNRKLICNNFFAYFLLILSSAFIIIITFIINISILLNIKMFLLFELSDFAASLWYATHASVPFQLNSI